VSSQARAIPDEQNNLNGIPRPVIAEKWWSVQIGGSARVLHDYPWWRGRPRASARGGACGGRCGGGWWPRPGCAATDVPAQVMSVAWTWCWWWGVRARPSPTWSARGQGRPDRRHRGARPGGRRQHARGFGLPGRPIRVVKAGSKGEGSSPPAHPGRRL